MYYIRQNLWQGRTLIAYGIGMAYKAWKKECLDKDFSFDYLADKKYTEETEQHLGVVTITTDQLLTIRDAVIVVFPYDYAIYQEVKEKYEDISRNVTVYSAKIFHEQNLLLLGEKLVEELYRGRCSEDGTYACVIRYHIGDTINLFPCIAAFKILHNNPERFGLGDIGWWYEKRTVKQIIAITNNRLKSLCDLCDDIDECIVYSEYELEAINCYLYCNGSFPNIIPDESVAFWQRNPVFVGSMSWYPYRLYDLPLNNEALNKFVKDYRISCNDNYKAEALSYISENGIIPESTVVLCPYAKSTSMMHEDVWNRIIYVLKQNGYRVMTNVGPGETPLQGTEAFNVSVNLMLALVCMGIRFLGVQSGIVDAVRRVNSEHEKGLVIWDIQSDEERLYAYDMDVLSCDKSVYVGVSSGVRYITFSGVVQEISKEEIIMNEIAAFFIPM